MYVETHGVSSGLPSSLPTASKEMDVFDDNGTTATSRTADDMTARTDEFTHRTDDGFSDESAEGDDSLDHDDDDGDDDDHCDAPVSFQINEDVAVSAPTEAADSGSDQAVDDDEPSAATKLASPKVRPVLERKPSILKRSNSEPLHIKDSRKAWKCLPKPDLNETMTRCASVPLELSRTERRERRDSSVRFSQIHVRSYNQTIGDNPSVSYGPPISLDWEYEEHEPLCLDHYEETRAPRRTLRQMVLSYYHRRNVLTWQYGHTLEEIKSAKKDAKRTKMERAITAAFLPVMKVEAAVESAGRKALRFVKRRKQPKVDGGDGTASTVSSS